MEFEDEFSLLNQYRVTLDRQTDALSDETKALHERVTALQAEQIALEHRLQALMNDPTQGGKYDGFEELTAIRRASNDIAQRNNAIKMEKNTIENRIMNLQEASRITKINLLFRHF